MFWPMRLTYSVYDRIVDELGAFFDLVGVGFAHLDFGIGGVPVAQATAANVAIANGADIFHAAGLDFDQVAADWNNLFQIGALRWNISANRGGPRRGLFRCGVRGAFS